MAVISSSISISYRTKNVIKRCRTGSPSLLGGLFQALRRTSSSVRSCHRLGLQVPQPRQIVSCPCPLHPPTYLLQSTESHLAQQTDRLHPAKLCSPPLRFRW